MPTHSRRAFLAVGTAGLLYAAAQPLVWAQGAGLRPTPANPLGPFYRSGAPETTDLIVGGEPGLPLHVAGRIVDEKGTPLTQASLEVFHADTQGEYDLKGFRYRGRIPVDKDGNYRFHTLVPGHYSDARVNPDDVRPEHIHYVVKAPGYEPLTTQLYFATDPFFATDPAKNLHKDPLVQHLELVRPVQLYSDNRQLNAAVEFDLCLARG